MTDFKYDKHKNFIWVTFQKEGIHKYPQALTDPELKDVFCKQLQLRRKSKQKEIDKGR